MTDPSSVTTKDYIRTVFAYMASLENEATDNLEDFRGDNIEAVIKRNMMDTALEHMVDKSLRDMLRYMKIAGIEEIKAARFMRLVQQFQTDNDTLTNDK